MTARGEGVMCGVRRRFQGCGTVYGLFDATGALRYIGATNGTAHARWRAHEQSGHRGYAIRILERCPNQMRFMREKWWIEWATGLGIKLLNKPWRNGRGGRKVGSSGM